MTTTRIFKFYQIWGQTRYLTSTCPILPPWFACCKHPLTQDNCHDKQTIQWLIINSQWLACTVFSWFFCVQCKPFAVMSAKGCAPIKTTCIYKVENGQSIIFINPKCFLLVRIWKLLVGLGLGLVTTHTIPPSDPASQSHTSFSCYRENKKLIFRFVLECSESIVW